MRSGSDSGACTRLLVTAAAAAAVLVSAGCVKKGPRHKKIDPAYIAQNLLSKPPASMTHAVNANLGGKVIYLGNDIVTKTLAPGGKVEIVHYWKVVKPPGAGWRVFAHVVGVSKKDWMNIDYTDMRAGYPPSRWKAGDIIRDDQKFALARTWTSPYAEIRVGLYRKGSSSAADRMPILSGPKTSGNSVPAARITVGKKVSAGYVVRKTDGPITIDGKADEPAWKSAPRSPAFTVAAGGKPTGGSAHARLLWDDHYLYAFIEIQDADVYSQYTKQDDPLWKQDAVEMFIDADRNRHGYVELQVNPRNAHFDAFWPQTRAQPSQVDWNSGMKSAVDVHGTLDNRDDHDQGWNVEVAIPLAAVKGRDPTMQVNIPPHVGDRWNLNIVRVEKHKSAKTVTASSWNPITIQDFHALDRMLTVTFGDKDGGTAPSAAPGAAAGAAAKPAAAAATMKKGGKVVGLHPLRAMAPASHKRVGRAAKQRKRRRPMAETAAKPVHNSGAHAARKKTAAANAASGK